MSFSDLTTSISPFPAPTRLRVSDTSKPLLSASPNKADLILSALMYSQGLPSAFDKTSKTQTHSVVSPSPSSQTSSLTSSPVLSSTKTTQTSTSPSSSSSSSSSLSFSSHCHAHSRGLPDLSLVRRSFWNTCCSCIFSSLPDELLLFNVFSFLSTSDLCTLSSVCTRWKFLASDPLNWRVLDLSKYNHKIDSPALESLLTRFGQHVEVLKLCGCTKIQPQTLKKIGALTANLRELHLCSLKHVDDSVLESIAASSPALQSISLYGCVQVTDKGVKALLSSEHIRDNLKELSLRGCHRVTMQALEALAPTALSSMAATPSANSLESLNLAGCKQIKNDDLSRLIYHSPNLQHLNAHGLNVTDATLALLPLHCPQLHTLHLSSANPFGGNALLTDNGCTSISQLSHLQVLNLQGSEQITDAGVRKIARRLGSTLRRLNLGGIHQLTDKGLKSVLRYCKQLTHLSIFQCVNVTDHSVSQLTLTLQQLQHLDLHSCVSLTGTSIDALLQSPSSSSSSPVDSESDEESDEEDDHFAKYLSKTSSSSVLSLSRSSSFVSENSDSDCSSNLSTSVVYPFRLPHLQSLDLGSCRNIPVERVESLKKARPEIQVTFY